ncbi:MULTISPECIES: polysaccharide deacetylase family protein [unclassified Sinorhizobium]|uniref:polysaccharide deacetylase family protein n=1 Tax=unclassified Sinorhizobium TaxID=2613772 RepID=UPI0024C42CCD|nr:MULTISPECIES: polysaccharide deacetylase family protein [unclassified Sinorhizobium]MDK1374010.1 polysaccharide deacetylase family protein [Sinorhizobium sp. 6-70]MDK1477423.1 polysaccharide deacetylase family protein [Sinorhizobium sp. 6-117]
MLDAGEADYWIDVDRFRQVLDRIANHPHRERLSITFDDGNISDLLVAAPELDRRGLKAEFFVLAGRIGQPGSLGPDDIRALMKMGMPVGSHGVAHCDWSKLSATELNYELDVSKRILEEICRVPIRSASIPFGRYNGTVLLGLRRAGYATAYSSDGGHFVDAPFLRPRTSVRRDATDSAIEQILSGELPIWRRLRRAVRMTITARTWGRFR